MTTDLGLRPVAAAPAKGRTTIVAAAELITLSAAELAATGHELLIVDGPVPAGQNLDEDLRLLRFLREATCHTLRLEWTLGGRPLVELRDLIHLVPPTDGVADAADFVTDWRAGYRYGLYYYRQGPGFVTVKDVRPGGEAVHLTIDGDSAAQFRTLATATTVADLDADSATALADVVDYGLALRGQDALLMLPYRLRRWPVPYSAV